MSKTDNELIAEFMGLKREVHSGLYPSQSGLTFDRAPEPLYDKSWDWLMPVVDKIDHLYRQDFPPGEEFIRRVLAHDWPIDEHYTDVVALPLGTPIAEVYAAIIQFIHWYNKNSES